MDPLLYTYDYLCDYSEYRPSTKTEEEIKKLTLEENLSELKRSIYILSKGIQIQKTAIYMNLHCILLEPESWQKVIPLINDEIVNQTEENQIEGAKSLVKLIKENNIEQNNLYLILKICFSMLKIWNHDVLDQWIIVFSELIQKIPYDYIDKECEQLILYLSEYSQHAMSKYIATRMIGFIAQYVSKPFTEFVLIFDRARVLCQDADFEVRKIMSAEVLEKICNNVEPEITENKLLEKILELLYDSDMEIKLHSIDLLINVLDLLSFECKKSRIIQTFIDFLATINEEIYKKISFALGKIIYKLEPIILKVPSHLSTFQCFYKECGIHKLSEVRKNFAYNLPYLITIFEQKDLFKNIYLKLLKDPIKEVKSQTILCFHEAIQSQYSIQNYIYIHSHIQLCEIIGAEESKILFKDTFESLLKEEDKTIIEKFLPKLSELVYIFVNPAKSNNTIVEDIKHNNSNNKQIMKSIYLEKLINLAQKLEKLHSWRMESIFLDEFEKIISLFTVYDLNEQYLPYLMHAIKHGISINIQRLACRNLISFMRINYITLKRNEIIDELNNNLYKSTNYKYRMLYIDIFYYMSKIFSTQYIKQHNILNYCMNLAYDDIIYVRRKFLEILPCLKKVILFNDNQNLKKYNDIINMLTLVKDCDIYKNLQNINQEFDNDIQSESLAIIEIEEKRRIDEEDELKLKEIRELEAHKKAKNEENCLGKLDYLQGFILDKSKPIKIHRKSIKETTLPKINSTLKPPSSSGPNNSGLIFTPKTKIVPSMPIMLPKQGMKINYIDDNAHFNSMYKPIGKLSTGTLLSKYENFKKKSNSMLVNSSENIYPKTNSSIDPDKMEKEKPNEIRKISHFTKKLALDDNFKLGNIGQESRMISSTNKLTMILKDKEIKEINPTNIRETRIIIRRK